MFADLVRLRLFVTAVDLHGAVLGDLTDERAFTLRLGGQKVRANPLTGLYRGVIEQETQELAVAIVIETAAPFAEVLPEIKVQVDKFIQALPKSSQVLVIGYDDDLTGDSRPSGLSRARSRLEALDSNTSATDPATFQLVDAVERAVNALHRARPKIPGAGLRRYVVVISDGKDADPTPGNYQRVSKRAASRGIRIHSIAYPPDRNRYPLLGLAEMSKRSAGTFRLILTTSGFASNLAQLERETLDQYVLSYYLPAEQVANKRVQLEAGGMTSEPVRVPSISCGSEVCGDGERCMALRCIAPVTGAGVGLAWLWIALAVVVGVLVLLFVVGLILMALKRRRQARADAAEASNEPEPRASASHRIVPQGPASGAMATPGDPALGHVSGQASGQTYGPGNRAPSQAEVVRVQPMAAPGMPQSGGYAAAPGMPQSGGYAAAPGMPQSGGYAAAPAGAPPSLLVLEGPRKGQRLPLQHGFVIGTAANCHLVLDADPYASTHHAHILMDARGGCTLVDRGSTNGTFVNGVRTQQKRLTHGMLIKIGATEARFLAQ